MWNSGLDRQEPIPPASGPDEGVAHQRGVVVIDQGADVDLLDAVISRLGAPVAEAVALEQRDERLMHFEDGDVDAVRPSGDGCVEDLLDGPFAEPSTSAVDLQRAHLQPSLGG